MLMLMRTRQGTKNGTGLMNSANDKEIQYRQRTFFCVVAAKDSSRNCQ